MASDYFPLAWRLTAPIEGPFQDNPNDPGNYAPDGSLVGTAWGVSARYNPGVDIRNLTPETAAPIARARTWDRYNLARLPPLQAIAAFDACYQEGDLGVRFLQRALGFTGGAVDGVLGDVTAARAAHAFDLSAALGSLLYRVAHLAQRPLWQEDENGFMRRFETVKAYLLPGGGAYA